MTSVSTAEEQVRGTLTAYADAIRAGDADRLGALCAGDVVHFGLAPPLGTCGAAVTERLREWFGSLAGPPGVEVRDLVVAAGDDVAFAHSLNRLSGTPQGAPEGFSLWMRATVGLRRVGGGWRVVHVHESTPFHMDGEFGAATDLEPAD